MLLLEEAETETCGSKSAACAQLARLAAKGSSFATAAGVCLPFGNMEAAIKVTFHAGSFRWLTILKRHLLQAPCTALSKLIIRPLWSCAGAIGEAVSVSYTVIAKGHALEQFCD